MYPRVSPISYGLCRICSLSEIDGKTRVFSVIEPCSVVFLIHGFFYSQAERKLLLTGTPLQNDLMELLALLTFLIPDMMAEHTERIQTLFSKRGGQDVCDLPLHSK